MSRKHNRPTKQNESGNNPDAPPHHDPPESDDAHERGKAYQNPTEKWRSPEGLTTIFTGILALFACLSFVVLWVQLSDARKNFILDERPWVWRSFTNLCPLVASKNLCADIQLANYGKNPALHERNNRHMFYGSDAMERADAWFSDLDAGKITLGGNSIIPPGAPVDPARAPVFVSAFSDDAPTSDDISYIQKTDRSTVVVARVEYTDSTGTLYRSDMCIYHLASGALADCERHNNAE